MPATAPCTDPCPPAPDGGCSAFPKGLFAAKETPAGKEKLLAKFIGGPALAQTDPGNPPSTGGTGSPLCAYDDPGNPAGEGTLDPARATSGPDPRRGAARRAPPRRK